jgi:hypothetical protein
MRISNFIPPEIPTIVGEQKTDENTVPSDSSDNLMARGAKNPKQYTSSEVRKIINQTE